MAAPTNGLILFWNMDAISGTLLRDISNHGRVGTLSGTTAKNGKIADARNFNGSTDFIYRAYDAGLRRSNWAGFSACAWINLASLGLTQTIVGRWNQLGQGSDWLLRVSATNRFEAYVIDADGSTKGTFGSDALATSAWNHVAFTWDGNGTNRFRLYINGAQYSLATASSPITSGTSNFRIGLSNDGVLPFSGVIDEVRIYNRSLSAAEISNVYNDLAAYSKSSFIGFISDGKYYGIQNIQEPVMDFYPLTKKSRLAYMNNATLNGRWGIKTYYHESSTWSTSVEFDTTNDAGDDNHRWPIVMHDNLGIPHVFYGAHNEPLRHARSNSPDSIQTWSLATSFGVNTTYPQLAHTTGGTFYMVYRKNDNMTWFRTSTNNMNTWTAGTAVVQVPPGNALVYAFGLTLGTNSGTQIIHMFGSFRLYADPNTLGRDPWYIKSADGGATWKSASGTTLALPINQSTMSSPYRGKAYEYSGCIDHLGRPHIFFDIERPGTTAARGDPYILMHAFYDGTSWSTSIVSVAGEFASSGYKSVADESGKLYLLWDHTTSSYGLMTSIPGNSPGILKIRLSKSSNSGSTWSSETLVTSIGPNVYLRGFCNSKYIRELGEVHLFYPGEPYDDSATQQKAFLWQYVRLGMPIADMPAIIRGRNRPFKWTRRGV